MIAKLDSLTKYIQQKIVELNLSERVNVIHLSDHGMKSITLANTIDLTKFVENGACTFYGKSPVLQVVPKHKGKIHTIIANGIR